jgi:hypothetical protein
LRAGIPGIGCLAIPLHRLRHVARHATAVAIEIRQVNFSF